MACAEAAGTVRVRCGSSGAFGRLPIPVSATGFFSSFFRFAVSRNQICFPFRSRFGGANSVNSATIGLALAYALPLTGTLNGLLGSFTEAEKEVGALTPINFHLSILIMSVRTFLQIVSVERAVEYLSVPAEGHGDGDDAPEASLGESISTPLLEAYGAAEKANGVINAQKRVAPVAVPVSWPRDGVVEFRDLTMSYRRGLAPSLVGVSFWVRAGERVGVVGRTGKKQR